MLGRGQSTAGHGDPRGPSGPVRSERGARPQAAVSTGAGSVTERKAQPSVAKSKQPSGRRLVIVESPAKARTIAGYLGPGYEVEASVGHIRDLPQPSEMPAE